MWLMLKLSKLFFRYKWWWRFLAWDNRRRDRATARRKARTIQRMEPEERQITNLMTALQD